MATRLGPSDYRDMPWKNGGGVTRELVKVPHPHDPSRFFVRLSIATVASSGPFSSFPGVDRTLTLLDGGGMALAFAPDAEVALDRPLRPLSFPGEAPVTARLLGGPVRDFNLMVDRAVGGASLWVEQLAEDREVSLGGQGLLLLHVLRGEVSLGDLTLQADETWLSDAPASASLRGQEATVIVVRAWSHAVHGRGA